MIISTALASTLISACFFAVCAFVTHWGVILFKRWSDKRNISKQQRQQTAQIISALQNMDKNDLEKLQSNLKKL